jgi:hypothetical protein
MCDMRGTKRKISIIGGRSKMSADKPEEPTEEEQKPQEEQAEEAEPINDDDQPA